MQIFFLFLGNLVTLSYGTTCGWPSAAFSILNTGETPLHSGPMSVDELSWMVSLLCVGGFVGNLFYGYITNCFGRKLPMLSLAVPMIVRYSNSIVFLFY